MDGDRRGGGCVPSGREERLIELVAQGLTNSQAAKLLGTSEHVVKNYLQAIYDKLGLWNRVELALWYEARKMDRAVTEQRTRGVTQPQTVAESGQPSQ